MTPTQARRGSGGRRGVGYPTRGPEVVRGVVDQRGRLGLARAFRARFRPGLTLQALNLATGDTEATPDLLEIGDQPIANELAQTLARKIHLTGGLDQRDHLFLFSHSGRLYRVSPQCTAKGVAGRQMICYTCQVIWREESPITESRTVVQPGHKPVQVRT